MKARTMLLLLGCGGLGWLTATADAGPRPLPPPAEAGAVTAARVRVSPPPAPVRAAWDEQVSRPLFTASRRPPETAPPAAMVAAPEPEPPPPVAASGVVLRPDGALALLRLADERTVRVVQGEEIEGWQVTRIFAGGVDVTRGDQTLTLASRIPAAEGMAQTISEAGEGDRPTAVSGGGGRRPPVRNRAPRTARQAQAR